MLYWISKCGESGIGVGFLRGTVLSFDVHRGVFALKPARQSSWQPPGIEMQPPKNQTCQIGCLIPGFDFENSVVQGHLLSSLIQILMDDEVFTHWCSYS